MTSALACIGLEVSDETGLDWLVTSAHRAVRETGVFDGVHVGRWQDDSGAALILGWQSGELLDFIPAYTATRGGLLSDCHLINESVAAATVVDADGRQLTAMAFEAEQYRQLQALGEPAGGPARITALGVDVQVHPDADAFAASPGSQLDPAADPDQEPPPHYRERGWSWPPRLAAESFISYGVFADPAQARPAPACPAPSWKPGSTSARSPGSRSPSPPSAPPDSRPTCAWPAASIPACQRPATSSAAPSSCPPPSTPPPSTAGSMSSDHAAADAPDPEHAAFVRLPAGAASDGRDRVMSRAARELQTRGTTHSTVRSHPGFVPDDYLAGPGPQTAITPAEPCTAPAGARPLRLPRARRGSDRGVHRTDARTQEDARSRARGTGTGVMRRLPQPRAPGDTHGEPQVLVYRSSRRLRRAHPGAGMPTFAASMST